MHKSNDIGLFVGKSALDGPITDQTRKLLLENVWRPDLQFQFPSSGPRNLKFQVSWLNKWDWLVYSVKDDGAYCLFCALFASEGAGRGFQSLGQLVKSKFANWKDAKERFQAHQCNKYHEFCRAKAAEFLAIMNKEKKSIEMQLNSELHRQVEENRKGVLPIISNILFCGRRGLPLRGHRDSDELNVSDEDFAEYYNDGNFRALLRFRVKSGDTALAQHFENRGKNAMYTSPRVQNEVISAANKIILDKIAQKVNAAKGFSVLADETTDISGVEQLTICARYLDSGCIREDFLQFVPVTDLSGKGLAQTIINSLREMGVDTKHLLGQGYDGVAAMSGRFHGAQSYVKESSPLAVYVHCSSHSFNLPVSDACSLQSIRNFMGTLKAACDFFRPPKRQNVLKTEILKNDASARSHRLVQLCPTRWVERHDSFIQVLDLMTPVVEALDQISGWEDGDTSSAAARLKQSICTVEFQVCLRVAAEVFSICLPLSRQLQAKELDLSGAMSRAAEAEESIQLLRNQADEGFRKIFLDVEKACAALGVELHATTIRRTAGRQIHRSNVSAENQEEYYKRAVYIPFLDSFLVHIKDRLASHRQLLASFSCLLPKSQSFNPLDEDVIKQAKVLRSTYEGILDCNETAFGGELRSWHQFLKNLVKLPSNAMEALSQCSDIFPAVRRALTILCTLPVTTATGERSFSTLRVLKSYLRSTCSENRLNGLALMFVHKNVPCSPEEILDELAKVPRRLNFKL